jgi:predicted nucleotidyltransferase
MSGLVLLAEQVGVSERTLRRAINEGTLRAKRPTPRKLEVDLAEREYVRRQWSLLSTLRETFRTEPNVRFALLFGSMAAGTDTPESDIDVLVDLRDASFERLVDLGTKLKEILGRHIDLVELHEAQSDPAFLAHVVAEGRVLVDREDMWTRLQGGEASLRRRATREERSRARAALAGIHRLLASP